MKQPTPGHPTRKVEVKFHVIDYCVLGLKPLLFNQIPLKACQQLLLPARRKNRAELESAIKHDPIREFRDSLYRTKDNSAPTRIVFPAEGFHHGMAKAAPYIPGGFKTEILSLFTVLGPNIAIYGVPYLYMRPERQGVGQRRVHDIRTRAILPEMGRDSRGAPHVAAIKPAAN
jgi:hypothetical protein